MIFPKRTHPLSNITSFIIVTVNGFVTQENTVVIKYLSFLLLEYFFLFCMPYEEAYRKLPFDIVKRIGRNQKNSPELRSYFFSESAYVGCLHIFKLLNFCTHRGWDFVVDAEKELGE